MNSRSAIAASRSVISIRDDFDNLDNNITHTLGKYTLSVITYIIYYATDAEVE